MQGVPRGTDHRGQVASALSEPVNQIVEAVKVALEARRRSWRLTSQTRHHADGGGALLRGLDAEIAITRFAGASPTIRCPGGVGCGKVLEHRKDERRPRLDLV